jgi:Cysteine rich repeat
MKNRAVFSGVHMNWLALVAGIFCLSLAAGVSAEEVDRPCAADVKKLCKDVQPGEGRIAQCMKEHEKELSPGCKENIKKLKAKAKEVADACKGDAKRLCPDVKPGEGRILRCLKQHESDLSSACKKEMTPPKKRG